MAFSLDRLCWLMMPTRPDPGGRIIFQPPTSGPVNSYPGYRHAAWQAAPPEPCDDQLSLARRRLVPSGFIPARKTYEHGTYATDDRSRSRAGRRHFRLQRHRHMNGRHQRIYRGHFVLVDVTRRDDDLVNVRITTRDMKSGAAGPLENYSEIFSLDLLGAALQKIRTKLDRWISDRDRQPVTSEDESSV
ncbi:hypothetical protein AWB81_04724 [Caballeronia arationis]|nr:hypothetical protein AWB81_04724 [Caballeronia arationis]